MKLKSTFLMLLFISYAFVSINAQWNLVWSDEFNYTGSPDGSKWNMVNWAPGNVNNELQAYTSRTENVRCENGNLIIEARRDWHNGNEYTSGRINSSYKGYSTYGRFEARMKLPGGWGTWAAFWMMPNDPTMYGWNDDQGWYWPNCGEIDSHVLVVQRQNTDDIESNNKIEKA